MPDWTLFVCAVLAGFMPSVSAMVRVRRTYIYRGSPQLQTAYALESVLDEVVFLVALYGLLRLGPMTPVCSPVADAGQMH